MNTIELLKTLRTRDKHIADALGVKVAQLNRRQKQIQQPSEESIQQLRIYTIELIQRLQQFLESEPLIPTIQESHDQNKQEDNDSKPLSEDNNEPIQATKRVTKSKKK